MKDLAIKEFFEIIQDVDLANEFNLEKQLGIIQEVYNRLLKYCTLDILEIKTIADTVNKEHIFLALKLKD